MRTAAKHYALNWIGVWPSAGAQRVVARNVGDTVQVYGAGVTATRFVGGIQPLPTDVVISTMTLTLTNVVIGSRIRIEEQVAGTLVDERTATGATEVFTVPVYILGSAKNDLRIKVRKGTAATKYQPFETLATAAVGAQSVYIAQVVDPIA